MYAQTLSGTYPSYFYSDTTPPTVGMNYNENTNEIHWYSQGEKLHQHAFPLAICTNANDIQSIDQVFNGFGFIGNVIFTLPGVKGIIPDGRNPDGTLVNKKVSFTQPTLYNLNNVLVNDLSYSVQINNNWLSIIANNKYFEQKEQPSNTNPTVWYNTEENIKYLGNGTNWSRQDSFNCGTIFVDNFSKISKFTTKEVFQNLDYSDTTYIAKQSFPSINYIELNIPASNGYITIPDNGWLALDIEYREIPNIGSYFNLMVYKKGVEHYRITLHTTNPGYNEADIFPVSKGDTVHFYYNNSIIKTYFKFIYASGTS